MIVKAYKMMIATMGSTNMNRIFSSNDAVGGIIKFMRETVRAEAVKRVRRYESRTVFESFLIRYSSSAFLERDPMPAMVASSCSLIPNLIALASAQNQVPCMNKGIVL